MPAASDARRQERWGSPFGRSVVVACCLLAGAIVVDGAGSREVTVPHKPLALLPMQIGAWEGRQGPEIDRDAIAVLGVDDFVNRLYSGPAQVPIALYVGYYGSQREGDTIHSPLNCLPGAGWQPVERRRMTITVPTADRGQPATTLAVNRLVIEKGLDRELVLYWYQSHGRAIASEYWGRILLAYDAFRLHRTDGALVRIIAPIEGGGASGETASEHAATAFVRAFVPVLSAYVPK